MSFQASILIPLLSQVDAWLEQCVQSALAQSVKCEVLVITSQRTPASNLKTLGRFRDSGLRYRVCERPREGFAAGLNHGIRLARAGRIGFLLSDDWLDPTAVEQCLRCAADIVCTGHTVYAADGGTLIGEASRTRTINEYNRMPDLERKASYLEHFFLFRRQALRQVGGLDESLGDSPGIDDYDLPWTMLEQGATVALVEERLYNYRDHDGVRLTTRDPRQMTATMIRILEKHGITGARQDRLLRAKAAWFGKPLQAVLAARRGGSRGPGICRPAAQRG